MKNFKYLLILFILFLNINNISAITEYRKDIISMTFSSGENRDTPNFNSDSAFISYGSASNEYINIGNNSNEMFNRHLKVFNYYQLYFPYSPYNNFVYESSPVDIINLTWNNEPFPSNLGNFINFLASDTDLNNSNTEYITIYSDVSPFYESYTSFASIHSNIEGGQPYISYNTPTIESWYNDFTEDESLNFEAPQYKNISFSLVGEDLPTNLEENFIWQYKLNNGEWINFSNGKNAILSISFSVSSTLQSRIYYQSRDIYSYNNITWNIIILSSHNCNTILTPTSYESAEGSIFDSEYLLVGDFGYNYALLGIPNIEIPKFEISNPILHIYCTDYTAICNNNISISIGEFEPIYLNLNSGYNIINISNIPMYFDQNNEIGIFTENYDINGSMKLDSNIGENKPYISYMGYGECVNPLTPTPTPTSTTTPTYNRSTINHILDILCVLIGLVIVVFLSTLDSRR